MIDLDRLWKQAAEYGIELPEERMPLFDRYADLLVDWNQRINLTSIVEPEEILVKHFLDSLLPLSVLEIPGGSSLIDVGTGAGFPSGPLAIAREDLKVTQIDSLNKRIVFLTEAAQQLGLFSLKAVHLRAEEGGRKPEYREQYDFATARAVASLRTLAEYCLPYVKQGGTFFSLKGYEIETEAEEAGRAVALLGGKLERIEKFELPDGSRRSIVIIKKISQTPTKYPRNQGKITKNPL